MIFAERPGTLGARRRTDAARTREAEARHREDGDQRERPAAIRRCVAGTGLRARATTGRCRREEIAGSLGLHPRSLWGWLQADAPIREVELIDDVGVAASHEGAAANHGLRLILRGGAEVVGLQLHEVIALVRALS